MRLDNSVIERLNARIDSLDRLDVSGYALINKLKDLYVNIVKNGIMSEDVYLDVASFVLYAGFILDE
jgi:hypothetical protein